MMMAGLFLNRWTIGLMALAASHLFAVYYGYQWADRSAEMAQLRAERDGLRQLWATSEEARDADAQALQHNQEQLDALRKQVDDDAAKLQNPDTVCFAPADTERLRNVFRSR